MEMTTPPDVPIPNYPTGSPSPKRKLGRAWASMWTELSTSIAEGGWVDGNELAALGADKSGLQENTLISFLTRAATAGILEREHRSVDGTRGPRKRTFYRAPRVKS